MRTFSLSGSATRCSGAITRTLTRRSPDCALHESLLPLSGGGRGIRTPGTVSGSVVFKASQGWEGCQPLPIYPNENGPFLHMSWALIGACPHQDTDTRRTGSLDSVATLSGNSCPHVTFVPRLGRNALEPFGFPNGRYHRGNRHAGQKRTVVAVGHQTIRVCVLRDAWLNYREQHYDHEMDAGVTYQMRPILLSQRHHDHARFFSSWCS